MFIPANGRFTALSRRSRPAAIGQVKSADGTLVRSASHDANAATGQTYGARMIHIRSSNVIESSFATMRHRTDRTKGCLTRDGMLAMIYKLVSVRRAQLATTARVRMAREDRRWGEVPRRSRSAKRSA